MTLSWAGSDAGAKRMASVNIKGFILDSDVGRQDAWRESPCGAPHLGFSPQPPGGMPRRFIRR